jgi:hypothetical protein
MTSDVGSTKENYQQDKWIKGHINIQKREEMEQYIKKGQG